jgi:hypothetical protein
MVLSKKLIPTYETLTFYLEAAIKLVDEDKIVNALEMFKEINKSPRTQYLKLLGE